ncbi:hypothetical protein IPG36_07850 [bacterium]|nr:MAG: hypothetical protein IPG36_07850 [bacterium]
MPFLITSSVWAIVGTVLILIPLLVFPSFRHGIAAIILLESLLFGLSLWVYSFLVTYSNFGFIGLMIGLIFAGVGVTPLAIIAVLIHSDWSVFWNLIYLFTLTIGSRIIAFQLDEWSLNTTSSVTTDREPKIVAANREPTRPKNIAAVNKLSIKRNLDIGSKPRHINQVVLVNQLSAIKTADALPHRLPSKPDLLKSRYARLESQTLWRAIKVLYWLLTTVVCVTFVIASISDKAHMYSAIMTSAITILTMTFIYILLKKMAIYVAYGSIRGKYEIERIPYVSLAILLMLAAAIAGLYTYVQMNTN